MEHNQGFQQTGNARVASVINPDHVSHPRGVLRNARPPLSKATKPVSRDSRSASTTRAAKWPTTRSTNLPDEGEHRLHRVLPQRLRLLRGCVAYILRWYAAWLWLPPQDPATKLPPNRRPLWLPLHCAAARQEASLRFVPRQPNPQKKGQHQENSRSSLISAFSPFCSLIKSTKPVSEMLPRRDLHDLVNGASLAGNNYT